MSQSVLLFLESQVFLYETQARRRKDVHVTNSVSSDLFFIGFVFSLVPFRVVQRTDVGVAAPYLSSSLGRTRHLCGGFDSHRSVHFQSIWYFSWFRVLAVHYRFFSDVKPSGSRPARERLSRYSFLNQWLRVRASDSSNQIRLVGHLSFRSKQLYWESSFLIEVKNHCSSSLGELLRSYSPILNRIRL